MLEILAERRPRDVVLDVLLALPVERLHLFVPRAHRSALAEDFERDALDRVAHPAAVLDKGLAGPAQHVDEARRHGKTGGIDGAGRRSGRLRADIDDAVGLDADV